MIKEITQTFEVRGEIIVIKALAKFDEKGNLVYDKVLDDIAMEKIYSIYRERMGYYSLEMIRQLIFYFAGGYEKASEISGMSQLNLKLLCSGSLATKNEEEKLELIEKAGSYYKTKS